MSDQSTVVDNSRSLMNVPSNPIAYIAILTALISAAIHLFLAPKVIGFDQTTGLLFVLNGLGFIGGILVFLTRYWRREFYLVAVGYALATIVAFFAMGGPTNMLSISSKIAEAVLALTATYLYFSANTA